MYLSYRELKYYQSISNNNIKQQTQETNDHPWYAAPSFYFFRYHLQKTNLKKKTNDIYLELKLGCNSTAGGPGSTSKNIWDSPGSDPGYFEKLIHSKNVAAISELMTQSILSTYFIYSCAI